MFWNRKRDTVEPPPVVHRYRLDDETANYGLYVFAPGEHVYMRDLQAMRDSGWRPLFIDVVQGEGKLLCVVCERIAS